MKKSKALTAIVTALAMIMPLFTVHAADKEYSFNKTTEISGGLTLTREEYYSTSGSAARTYIYDCAPGQGTMPMVVYGSKIYGKSDINYAAKYCQQQGYTVMAGFNADFFSLNTGVPTGLVIVDGRLCSSDGAWNAIGFKADGTAIAGPPKVDITMTAHGQMTAVAELNKVRNGNGIFLYSEDYSSTTHLSAEGPTVVLQAAEGQVLKIGQSIDLVVQSAGVVSGETPIGPGQFVLTAQASAQIGFDLLSLQPGDTVTIRCESRAAGWADCVYAVGGGNMLATGGVLTSDAKDSGRDPRTVLGVRSDGSFVVLLCDGRSQGVANGETLYAVAQRLLAMGCTEVINLDGGGSTAGTARDPGKPDSEVINDPSDGALRKCANYIMLVNNGDPNQEETQAAVYPADAWVLAGGHLTLSAYSYNDSYYPKNAYSDSFTIADGPGYIEGNVFYSEENAGTSLIGLDMGGMASSFASINTVTEPETMAIVQQGAKTPIKTLAVEPGKSIDLSVLVTDGLHTIISEDRQFAFFADSRIGTIDQEGVFSANDIQGITGVITAEFMGKAATINVMVGTAPEILAAFEAQRGMTVTTPEGDSAAAQVSLRPEHARYGTGALHLSYNAAAEGHFAFAFDSPLKLKKGMSYISFMVRGGGSYSMDFTVNGSVVSLPFEAAGGEWQFVSLPVPAGATAVNGFSCEAAAASAGNVYIDQIIGHYGQPAKDVTGPAFNLLSEGGYEFVLQVIEDGKYPLEKDNITLLLDGAAVPFEFDTASSVVSFTVPEDGKKHKITVIARDYFGNIGRFFTETAGETASSFIDLEGHWGKTYIEYLADKGVFTPDVKFNPNGTTNNAMTAAIISRYLKLDTAKYASVELPYGDLASIPDWALPHVKALYAEGIMRGSTDGKGNAMFYPLDGTSRAQVMTVMGRTVMRGYEYTSATYSDYLQAPEWARDHISLLSHLGIVTGYGGQNEVKASAGITRAEIASLLYKMY